jgi:hypothetical protein
MGLKPSNLGQSSIAPIAELAVAILEERIPTTISYSGEVPSPGDIGSLSTDLRLVEPV